MLALLLLACLSKASVDPDQAGPFHEGDPSISGLSLTCDTEAAKWSLDLRTVGWTGGGRLYIAARADQVELHNLSSDKADRDGAWDCLDLSLSIAPDWQDASSGSSTRWRCADAPALSFALIAYDPTSDHASDCRVWGADPGLWSTIEGGPSCDTLPDTGEDWPGDVDACGG